MTEGAHGKFLKTWNCVACGSIQPATGQYPNFECRCGGTEFIRDEITIPGAAHVGTEEGGL